MHGNCYLLCAAGYAETSMQQAVAWLQRAGIAPIVLGLKSGSIAGAAGSTVPAEVLISSFIGEEAQRPLPDGLLLAGGSACGRQLLTDPRVHLLVQQMCQAAKPVGFLHPVSYPFVDLLNQQADEQPFLLQKRQAHDDFMCVFGKRLYQAQATTSLR
ncbi:MAG TPA: DJ-1/PfpI family protein [Chloroflexota bacterium]|nr:DJ-1/PfpI family protein [Chloroflexota bacterium]